MDSITIVLNTCASDHKTNPNSQPNPGTIKTNTAMKLVQKQSNPSPKLNKLQGKYVLSEQ